MAAHRYWRLANLEPYGFTGLELTELQLFAGEARVDASATLTASIASAAGVLSNLKDDDTGTGASWGAVATALLTLDWDFGAGGDVDATNITLGAAGDPVKFLQNCVLWYSDNGTTYARAFNFIGIAWPEAWQKTANEYRAPITSDPVWAWVDGLYGFESSPKWVYEDQSYYGRPLGIVGAGVSRSTAQAKWGTTSLLCGGDATSYLTSNTGVPAVNYAVGDNWTLECWAYQTSRNGTTYQHLVQLGTSNTNRVHIALAAGSPRGYINQGGTIANAYVGAATIPLNTWVHLAFVKVGTVHTLYQDGVVVGSITTALSLAAGACYMGLGNNHFGPAVGDQFVGHLDDVRFSHIAWYTAAFTPPGSLASQSQILVNAGAVRSPAGSSRIFVPTGAVTEAMTYDRVRSPVVVGKGRSNYYDPPLGAGLGRVVGAVKDDADPDVPVYRKVRLHRMRDGICVGEQWSDKVTGVYDFRYVDELQRYYVVAFDHGLNFRAVIADNLAPTLLPA